MNADVYRAFYPDRWRVSQQKAVEDVCIAEDTNVWVAIDAGSTVGFVAVKLHSEDSMGEIYMVAVDPNSQGGGIGSALIDFALACQPFLQKTPNIRNNSTYSLNLE